MNKRISILTTITICLIAVLSCTKDSGGDWPSESKSIVVEQSSVTSFTANIAGRFIGVDKTDLALGKRGLLYCLKTANAEKLFNSWLDGNDNPECMVLDKVTVESETMYCTLTGLFPDTEYSFCLYLQKRDGTRETSVVSSFKTQPFNPDIKEVTLNEIQCFVAFVEGIIAFNGKDVSGCETGVIVSEQNNCNIGNSTIYRCGLADDFIARARIADLEPDKEYYCRSYVKYQLSTDQYTYLYGPEKSFTTKDFMEVAVDLGLPSGLIWASYNVGADKPEDYGDFYAWGETEPYYEEGYAWSNYKYCYGRSDMLTKYCNNANYGYNGFTDKKTILDPDDDVAYVRWGGGWRMPTVEEMNELNNAANCTWTWTTINGVNGYRITSKKSGYTDRSIFLPAAGDYAGNDIYMVGESGLYWTSSLRNEDPRGGIDLQFNLDVHDTYGNGRCLGRTVRPVFR